MTSLVSGLLGGGPKTTVSFPGRSPEESALLSEQTSILRKQQAQLEESLRQQNLLQPLLFGQLGIKEVRDASGQLTGYERDGPQAEIDKLLQDKQLAALKGNLPVDPRFESDRASARETFGELMMRNLGPGWETSTPGIEALTAFDAETEGLRYGIRTGELTTADALARGRQTQTFGGIMQGSANDLPFIQAGTGVGQAFSGPLSNMLQNRSGQFQASQASASNALNRYGTNVNASTNMFRAVFGV